MHKKLLRCDQSHFRFILFTYILCQLFVCDKYSHMKDSSLRHCLIFNLGVRGFSLTSQGMECYPDITSLIKIHQKDRLSRPVVSPISVKFRQEWLAEMQEEDEGGIYANPTRLLTSQLNSFQLSSPTSPPPPTPPSPSSHDGFGSGASPMSLSNMFGMNTSLSNIDNNNFTHHPSSSQMMNVHNPPLLHPPPHESPAELRRNRLTQLEALETNLSSMFDSARALSLDTSTMGVAFDELVQLAEKIELELNKLDGGSCSAGSASSGGGGGGGGFVGMEGIVRKRRTCSLLIIRLRTLIAAADLSTYLANSFESSSSSSSSSSASAGHEMDTNKHQTGIKFYNEVILIMYV
jgi:hypothetical protein